MDRIDQMTKHLNFQICYRSKFKSFKCILLDKILNFISVRKQEIKHLKNISPHRCTEVKLSSRILQAGRIQKSFFPPTNVAKNKVKIAMQHFTSKENRNILFSELMQQTKPSTKYLWSVLQARKMLQKSKIKIAMQHFTSKQKREISFSSKRCSQKISQNSHAVFYKQGKYKYPFVYTDVAKKFKQPSSILQARKIETSSLPNRCRKQVKIAKQPFTSRQNRKIPFPPQNVAKTTRN